MAVFGGGVESGGDDVGGGGVRGGGRPNGFGGGSRDGGAIENEEARWFTGIGGSISGSLAW